MRGTGSHTAPTAMQIMPTDNTTRYVMMQVSQWRRDSLHGRPRVIHTESAREIAAWYQGPTGYDPFERFAGAGEITDDLHDAIDDAEEGPLIDVLRALRAYVRACPVVVYTVGYNTPGYLPESDNTRTLSADDAVRDLGERIGDWAESEYERETAGTPRADETDFANGLAEILRGARSAEYADEVARVKLRGTSYTFGNRAAFWINVDTMPYGEFIDIQSGVSTM